MYKDMYIFIYENLYIYMYMYLYLYMYMHMYMCVCVSFCLLCGSVPRRVSRVVARYVLFVVHD